MRRERWSILGDILAAIDRDGGGAAAVKVTHLAAHANLPHDRLMAHLQELMQAGLVVDDGGLALSPAGREFLREYRQWRGVLRRFGIAEDRDG